ncbi:MAG: helix-turn-helix transcriptional regulator [Dehalococcoidia bacterium]|nr:helix-turn-helix transcriptional regulator [Dehalococcoidia bacterium]
MANATSRWRGILRAARERSGVTRAQLAALSGVPADTIRRWEDGTRNPTLPRLLRVLDALDCPSAEANDILEGAGFPTQRTLFPTDRFPHYFYTVDELQIVVEEVPWPEFVLNDNIEIVAANLTAQAVWRIDLPQEKARRKRQQINLLSVASGPEFIGHVVNWDEAVATLASVLKGRPRDPHTLDQPDPYFNAVLADFAQGDPAFLGRLIEVFASAPSRDPKCRWTYPVHWKDDDFGEMRFIAVVNTASEPDGLAFNDWIPVDAASWNNLEQVKARARRSA